MSSDKEITLADWIRAHITDDPRALAWLEGPECEPRIRRGYQTIFGGYAIDPATILKETRPIREGEQPGWVKVEHLHFYSTCAHHFLPFFGEASIAYLPGRSILALGKLPRLVDAHARRFQIQEDLTLEIAQEMMRSGGAREVKVVTRARHLCMCARGPSQDASITEVSVSLPT